MSVSELSKIPEECSADKNLFLDIYKNLQLSEDMEATDTEGWSYDATATYKGKEYYVYLSVYAEMMNGDSFEIQAAKDIYKELTQKQ
ncbi:MAG: hypothetical protein J5929_01895 [Eubacterium sp.]|nr:hypothetical protein [Eubacterium sp.]